MTTQDIVYPLGEFLDWALGLIEVFDNYPNILVTIGGFAGISLWVAIQKKYTAKAYAENTLK